MDGECGSYEGREKCIWILIGKPEGKRHVKDLHVDGRIILKWVLGLDSSG